MINQGQDLQVKGCDDSLRPIAGVLHKTAEGTYSGVIQVTGVGPVDTVYQLVVNPY